jgi:hypothetical protein
MMKILNRFCVIIHDASLNDTQNSASKAKPFHFRHLMNMSASTQYSNSFTAVHTCFRSWASQYLLRKQYRRHQRNVMVCNSIHLYIYLWKGSYVVSVHKVEIKV